MFSRTSEYALRAVAWLAMTMERAQTTAEIAKATGVPPSYLAKVLQTLARSGLVHSQRGLGGGFTLARRPDQVTVLQVINAVDPLPRIEGCPLHLQVHSTRLCRLHDRLNDALGTIEAVLAEATIESLYAEDLSESPLGIASGASRAAGRSEGSRGASQEAP